MYDVWSSLQGGNLSSGVAYVRAVDEFVFNGAAPGRYLYHYTRPDTLALILDSGRIRLGSYAETNDPRERKQWLASLTADTFDDLQDGESLELVMQIDRWIRRGVRLSCFTVDYPEPPDWAGGNFHSGWARARMWHQYAGDHTGAVLVFDAERPSSRWSRPRRGTRPCPDLSPTPTDR